MHGRHLSVIVFVLVALSSGRVFAETSSRPHHAWSRQKTVVAVPPVTAVIGRDPTWRASVVRVKAAPATTGALGEPRQLSARQWSSGHAVDGIASYYSLPQKTASGELYDRTALTAAHRTLPFNTRVKVTHAASGRSVIVRINDRGPFKHGRVIDLSERAADVLDMRMKGVAHVKLEILP
jgi:rare lipoprotein A (peptidoglycan hydrolase)